MSCSRDLTLKRGGSYRFVFRWYQPEPVHKAITALAAGWPTLVTAAAHGLPSIRTPLWLTNLRGPSSLNAKRFDFDTALYGSAVDADTVAVDVNSLDLTPYAGGGLLTYYAPVDMTGYTARMQARTSVGAATPFLDLTTENGGLAIDPLTGATTALIDAVASAAIGPSSGVYDLKVIDPSGFVTFLAAGRITIEPEVTQ